MKDNGWIEWGGGDIPCPVNVMVEYRMRDGFIGSCFADGIRWRYARLPHEYPAADIMAYRIIGSDWIDWGGGDCPVHKLLLIEPKLRSGKIMPPEIARYWDWRIRNTDNDIVAYRIIGSEEE